MDIEWLKLRWKGWKEKRFLDSYGCRSWREYERKYDLDFSNRAGTIKKMYHGYSRVYAYPGNFSDVYDKQRCDDMVTWCKLNCVSKWRHDELRVIHFKQSDDWVENGIVGGDQVFFAFKDDKDAVMFLLIWQ